METRFPTQLLPGDGHREENVRVPKESAYSCRRATIGSTRIALLVGTKAANKVTTIRVAATIENASGSLGFTPNRNFASSRVRPYAPAKPIAVPTMADRKSTRLNSSHGYISYAVFCLKKKTLFSIFSPVLAWDAVAFLIITGCGVPLLSGILTRGLGKRQLAIRGELNAQIVDGIQGVPDLLAYGQADTQLRSVATLEKKLDQIQQRMAVIAGLQQALNDLLMNLALWSLLILAIPLVVAKAIAGVYLAFLALVILASFEAVQPLAEAFQKLGHSIAAGER